MAPIGPGTRRPPTRVLGRRAATICVAGEAIGLSNGADRPQKMGPGDDGRTQLTTAVEDGHPCVVPRLLEAYAVASMPSARREPRRLRLQSACDMTEIVAKLLMAAPARTTTSGSVTARHARGTNVKRYRVRRQNRITRPTVNDQPTGQAIRRWELAKDRCRPVAVVRLALEGGECRHSCPLTHGSIAARI
jgi:hypothetical protein